MKPFIVINSAMMIQSNRRGRGVITIFTDKLTPEEVQQRLDDHKAKRARRKLKKALKCVEKLSAIDANMGTYVAMGLKSGLRDE